MRKRKRKVIELVSFKLKSFCLLLVLGGNCINSINSLQTSFDLQDYNQHLMNSNSTLSESHSDYRPNIEQFNFTSSEQAANDLDPLIAIESGAKLLVIGKDPAQINQAPYESEQLATQTRLTSSSASRLNNHQQVFKFLHPNEANTTLKLSAPANWPNFYLPSQQQIIGPNQVGQPVISASLPAPTWSAYSSFLNQSRTTTTKPLHHSPQQRQQQPFVEYSDEAQQSIGFNKSSKLTSANFPSAFERVREDEIDEFESINSLANGNYQKTHRHHLTNTTTSNNTMTWSQLLKQASESNIMESLTITNKSMISLICDTNDMLLKLKFKKPFKGLIQTNLDKLNSCKLFGNGSLYYEMRISLNACGTRQEMPRLFINNVQISFYHLNQLDMTDDEIKTIICSYPIKPRAPAPPELNISEKIIDQSSFNEPAKLIHYEPIILISGLIILALMLLGFLTSAYMFTKRFSSINSATGTRRSYRPASSATLSRTTINPNFLVPPLIKVDPRKNYDDFREKSRVRKYPNSGVPFKGPTNKSPNDLNQNRKQQDVSYKPNADNSTDSLGGRNANSDQSSVTTIEIPYSIKNNDNQPNIPRLQQDTSPKQVQDSASKKQDQNYLVKREEFIKSFTKTTEKITKTNKPNYNQQSPLQRQASKKVQAEEQQLPKFGSLRAKLTSPSEFKRLQEIVRLFDEILIENRITKINESDDKERKKTLFVYNTRLSPSKYRSRILDVIDEVERKQINDSLHNDEVFRNLIVESTNRETFNRKLRHSLVYSSKFKDSTWDLLQEILLDPDVTGSGDPVQQQQSSLGSKESRTAVLTNKTSDNKDRTFSRSQLIERRRESSNSQAPPTSLKHHDSLTSLNDPKLDRAEVDEIKSNSAANNNDNSSSSSKSTVRVSQFNSSKEGGSMTGTLINIDSITNFNNKNPRRDKFKSYTRSSIEHSRTDYGLDNDDLPYMDEKDNSYEYAKETLKYSPKLKRLSNQKRR